VQVSKVISSIGLIVFGGWIGTASAEEISLACVLNNQQKTHTQRQNIKIAGDKVIVGDMEGAELLSMNSQMIAIGISYRVDGKLAAIIGIQIYRPAYTIIETIAPLSTLSQPDFGLSTMLSGDLGWFGQCTKVGRS
jgi:hypothetical protein